MSPSKSPSQFVITHDVPPYIEHMFLVGIHIVY